ncbi:MAG: rhomboid family intramembrane serine protease [Bacteroidales bacterium]|jgi:membrane associated rhomboid family serine protease
MDIAVKRLYISMFFPAVLLLLIWLVFLVDYSLKLDLVYFGIYPRKLSGLPGILFSPFIHGGIKHIVANSLPLFALFSLLFYFYRNLSFRVLIISYICTGFMVWAIARPSYHVGASGIIYALAGFLFVSGIIRKHLGLIAISFLVAFQYGSMIWGIFPIEDRVSWESHLSGLLTGLCLAFYYRNRGPKGSRLFWQGHGYSEDDEAESESADELPWNEYEVEGPIKNMPPDSPEIDDKS